jgi:hypothetical protein
MLSPTPLTMFEPVLPYQQQINNTVPPSFVIHFAIHFAPSCVIHSGVSPGNTSVGLARTQSLSRSSYVCTLSHTFGAPFLDWI